MVSRSPKQVQHEPSHEPKTHAQFLLLALSRAAQSIQRAHTAEDFYHAVGREIHSLGGEVTLLLMGEDQKSLSISYLSFMPEIIGKAEQMTGLSMRGYRIPILPGGIFERTLQSRTAVYIDSSREMLIEALPKPLQALSGTLLTVFNLRQGILAPLWVENEALGLFMVNGAFLTHEDLPAMESFAGQIAAGLYNVRLMQKLKDELSARKQAEEALTHSRSLLLALGRAANQVQLAREPDDIYKVVGEQIRALGYEVAMLMFGSDPHRLYFRYTTIPEKVLYALEKITGLPSQNYSWMVSDNGRLGTILREGTAQYIPNIEEIVSEALSEFLRPMLPKLQRLANAYQGIFAPLSVGDQKYGFMVVFGNSRLSADDLPAVESFAGQVSVSLWNATLAKQVKSELEERKQVEKTLRLSHATFEGIFNSVTETIYVQDENGVFLNVNTGAERMYGYPREGFIGRTPEFLSAPGKNDLEKFKTYVRQAFNGDQVEFEFWGIRKNGTVFLKEVHLAPSLYYGQRVVIAVARDITDRKRAEETLRVSEAKVHALLDSVPDVLFVFNRAGEFLDYYTSHEDQLLVSPTTFLGRNIRDVMPADIVEKYFASLSRLEQTGESQLLEYSLNLSHGLRHFETHLGIHQQDNILCVVRDVTDRKQVEKSLAKQYEALNSLYQMTATLSSTTLIEEVYTAALDTLQNILELRRVAILLFDAEGVMRFKAWRGLSDDYRAVAEGHSPWTMDATNPEPVLVSDAQADPTLEHLHPLFSSEGIGALGFIPLLHQGRLLGKFMLYCDNPHTFVDDEIQLAQTIARHVALAISRQQTQEALASSESELRALFASMRDTVLVIDQNGVYRKIAPVSFEPLYIHPEDILGKNISDFFPPEKVQEFLAVMRHVLKTGQMTLIEYEMQIGEHQPWFESAVSPMGTDATIWVARNITERKKIEAALVRSELAHRTLFEEMPIGLYRTRVTGGIVDINSAMAHMFGFSSPSEMMQQKAWDYYNDPAANDTFIREINKTGSLSSFEAEYVRKDGTTFWAEDYARIVYDKDGKPEYYEGSLIDTTERKHTAEELKKSEALYRLLAERVADVVWVLDIASMKLKYISPSVHTMLGYMPEEVLERPIEEFIAPESVKEIRERLPARSKRFTSGDFSVVTRLNQIDQFHKNGSIITTEISSTLMLNPSGQLEAIGVSRDISQRKQAEDSLRQANISLAMTHRELQQMFEHEQVLARTDSLTKLHNRRYFFELASREFTASLRYKRPLTVILFDVDDFKPANDSYGHAMGDAILRQIASIASSQVRDVDILARYGGDEFTILLPQTTAEQAFHSAERLREAVAEMHVEEAGNSLSVTLSLGIADINLDPPDASIEDAIRRADQALYKAKQSGRNHTIVHS